MSIRTRLTVWYSGILAATLLVFGVVIYTFLSATLYGNQKDGMKELGNYIDSGLSWMELGGGYIPYLPEIRDMRFSPYFVQVVNPEGEVLTRSNNRVVLPRSPEMLNRAASKGVYFTKVRTGKVTLLIYNRSLLIQQANGTQWVGVLQIAAVVNEFERLLQETSHFLLVIAFLVITVAATVGWFLARKALKPIGRVIEAAGQIQKGTDLARRIDYNGPPDEIGRLTKTINGMLSRIQGMYEELEESNRVQRRFVSDASHELRTPLTTIRGNVDLLEKVWRQAEEKGETGLSEQERRELSLEAMEDIAGEARRMSRLVNDLLSLARADAGVQVAREPVHLLSVVEEVARKAALLPKKAEWRVGDLGALEGVRILGNADYLQQLLFIFIENAFKYTPEGDVVIDAQRKDGQIGIRITDTGIGMDKDEIPHIFERFYRADPSRGKTSGTGLGLSIAKWIIDEHGGSIEVTTRKGEGSTFLIWLPVYEGER